MPKIPPYTLTILDTVGIQNYIFGSNRLRENIGASELVKQATESWVYKLLPEPNNITAGGPDDSKIEDGQLQAELIYAGGGNTLIIFAAESEAKNFVTRLGEKLITAAPGVELAVVHIQFDWENDALGGENSGQVFEALGQLARLKLSQTGSRPMAGLGITATCQSTGQVATTTNAQYKASTETPRLISAEVEAKLRAQKRAPRLLGDSGYEMMANFDEVGVKDESSYLAVVHADGNNMGRRVEEIGRTYAAPAQNRAYIRALRDFSGKVKRASQAALTKLEEHLVRVIRFDDKGVEKIGEVVPVKDKQAPYRRLVFGGDDLTFVCDGRLALTLTAAYLEIFEQQTAGVGLPDVHACAGIAVVKSHYPFARAYQLAEALCKNAKTWVRENGPDFSALDWHFAPEGLMGELEFIRAREYQLPGGKTLLMRPIALDKTQSDWRNWPTFAQVVAEFQKDKWATQRNKVQRLRDALRAGREGVKQFIAAYPDSKLPEFSPPQPTLQTSGWHGQHCGYYDPIEAMDFFVPLADKKGGNP